MADRPAARPVRLDALTGLRWWAAFAVFVHHLGNLVAYPAPVAALTALGVHGVTFFFVLSGFVLTWSSGRALPGAVVPDARTFWWRRIARIYPAHLVALVLAVPVFTTLLGAQAGAEGDGWWVRATSLGVLGLSIVLLQGWSRTPEILFSGNPAAWTLSCEAFFYALHPAVDRRLARLALRGTLAAAGAVVALMVVLRVLTLVGGPFGGVVGGLPWPVLRLTEFLLGMACARAVALGWRPRLRPGLVVAVVAGVGGWLALSASALAGSGRAAAGSAEAAPVLEGVLGVLVAPGWLVASTQEVMTVATALLVVAVACRTLEGRPSVLERRSLVVLGEWSYAFYLVHATVIYVALGAVGQHAGLAAVAWGTLVLAGSLGAAWALHAWVERPAERRLRGAWEASRAARAA